MTLFDYRNKKNKNYFEGWYFRFTDTRSRSNYAVIFGLTKEASDPHSFIQIFDSKQNNTTYTRYTLDDFSYDKEKQIVSIKNNTLSLAELRVKTEEYTIEAVVEDMKGFATDSIMGPLQNAPLECFQEIIYMEASVKFTVLHQKRRFMGKGKSYMEKTMGKNFPKKWIWIQSNYSEKGSTISLGIAKLPFLFFRIKGFYMLLNYENKTLKLTSYNLSRARMRRIDKSSYIITIRKGFTKIEMTVLSDNPGILKAPTKGGKMNMDILESISGSGGMNLYYKGKLVFNDMYQNIGVEFMY